MGAGLSSGAGRHCAPACGLIRDYEAVLEPWGCTAFGYPAPGTQPLPLFRRRPETPAEPARVEPKFCTGRSQVLFCGSRRFFERPRYGRGDADKSMFFSAGRPLHRAFIITAMVAEGPTRRGQGARRRAHRRRRAPQRSPVRPPALRVAVGRPRLLCRPSSTMSPIACVAAPCTCPPQERRRRDGARAKM